MAIQQPRPKGSDAVTSRHDWRQNPLYAKLLEKIEFAMSEGYSPLRFYC